MRRPVTDSEDSSMVTNSEGRWRIRLLCGPHCAWSQPINLAGSLRRAWRRSGGDDDNDDDDASTMLAGGRGRARAVVLAAAICARGQAGPEEERRPIRPLEANRQNWISHRSRTIRFSRQFILLKYK